MTAGGGHRPSTPSMRHTMAITGEHRTSLREVRAAVFFDRDGTLIKDVGYIKSAADVELVAHAANAVRRMNYALWPVIVVTNQSGIARGLLTFEDYLAVRERLDDVLADLSRVTNSPSASLPSHFFSQRNHEWSDRFPE